MFICSGEEEFCSGALVREAVCQKLGPGVRNHAGRWTAESRLGPFKESVHHFMPACQSVPYLSGPDTMLVCVFACKCGSRQTLRLLNVTRHIQATDPRRRKGKTQRYDGTRQLTSEGGNLIGKKSAWTEWVCVDQWTIISSNGLLVVFVFQYGKRSLLLMRFDQWAHSEASKQPPLAGWKKQTTATFVSRLGRHLVSILTSFAAAAIEMLKQFLPPFLHLMFVIFAGLNSWKQS